MKKIVYIISILSLLLTSCSDWLDVKPPTSLDTGDAITNITDAQVALNGVYSVFQGKRIGDAANGAYYGAQFVYYPEVLADDMRARADGKRSTSVYKYLFRPASSQTGHWAIPYNAIRQASTLIQAIDQVTGGTKEERDRIKAQALALRGLALFDMTRIFGYPYTKDNGASLGVPIVTEPLGRNELPSRKTVAECYTQIITDFTDAIGLFPDTKKGNGFINIWGAKALLSRVYLYKGDLESNKEALRLAEEVIIDATDYRLWTNAEYPNVWGVAYSNELLFEIVNVLNSDWQDREAIGYLYHPDGYDDIVLTDKFLTLLKQDPDDVRLKVVNGVYTLKFPGKPKASADPRDNNIPVIRLSEVYLNAAEAAFKANETGKALIYLNDIVERANPVKTVASGDLSLDRILEERRKELVGEGFRFFDLMRNNLPVERVASDLLPAAPQTIKSDSIRIVQPIPKIEMDANKNMVQNLGYGES